MNNKHGRVGVKRQRPTRAELKRNMYQHGFTAGSESVGDKLKDEREFVKSLLKLKSAAAIHEAVRIHVS